MAPQRTVRTRKLNNKIPLQVLREDEIESVEYKELLENQFKVETGVEKSEENEYHLQEALAAPISNGHNDARKIVPAPPAEESKDIRYDELYRVPYAEPSTFIRFSQTVEECNGCQYDMTTEDENFLKSFNQKRPLASQCTEDDFEKIIEVFEQTADHQTPFAALDNTPVVDFERMEIAIKQETDDKSYEFAAPLYEYWRSCRENSGNKALQPSLKFEVHQDSDDGDPYVCFRRRDVRQTRKTRARDIQSTDKLKRLRKELEEGRRLVKLSHDRELAKRKVLEMDRRVFDQRGEVKKIRQDRQIKVDDTDLLPQKAQKRKPPEVNQIQRLGQGPQAQPSRRLDGQPLGPEINLLSDILALQEEKYERMVKEKVQHFQKRNQNFVDLTREPLSPLSGQGIFTGFRHATTNYLLTPPHSSNSSQSEDESPLSVSNSTRQFSKNSAPFESAGLMSRPAFRRRWGRGGRLWVDRRNVSRSLRPVDDWVSDRMKYDHDAEENEDVYMVDAYSTDAIKFRAMSINFDRHQAPRSAHAEVAAPPPQIQTGNNASSVTKNSSSSNPGQSSG